MTRLQGILVIFFTVNNIANCAAIHCKDHSGNVVDWFVVYKLPKIKQSNELIENGVGYSYMTSDDYKNWKLSEISINSTESIIGKTLQPLYAADNVAYILYNDQPPDGSTNSNKGHTKGTILANSAGGLWLVHSVPHFPPPEGQYQYPSTGTKFGQSFLCLSLNLKNLNEVGLQLQYNTPQIYKTHIPSDLVKLVGSLVDAADNKTVKQPPWYRQTMIETINGSQFVSFAKAKKFNKDLYEDWIAPALHADLLVETWPNGPRQLPSNCTKRFKVYNVESITMTVANVTFSHTHDHSKWAVSAKANNWICVGDINRMGDQIERGGGSVCLNNEKLSQNYYESVTSIEKCKNGLKYIYNV